MAKEAPGKSGKNANERKSAPHLPITSMLLDTSAPIDMRCEMLRSVASSDDPKARAAIRAVLETAAGQGLTSEDLYAAKLEELNEIIGQMTAGPLRLATFLSHVDSNGLGQRAQCALQDGSIAFPVIPDKEIAKALRAGENVWLEAQARALLYRDAHPTRVGEEARFERAMPGGLVEVSLREQGKSVYFAAADLTEQIERGEANPGDTLIVCPMRNVAFRAVAHADGLSHYRYLVREAVPDVRIERDVANPPAFLEELSEHVRTDLKDPDLHRRYRLRRCAMVLLTGLPGTGKSWCIHGLWNRVYRLMSEATGLPVEELPPRVLRFRGSQILSKWLGEADKAIDRFFDEIEELAAQTITDAAGRERQLPLLVIFEEADGIARERGEDHIHDRIQTTLLQRLDVGANPRLGELPVIFLFTTNTPQLVDPAFLRRAGGTTHHFGRLEGRSAFREVLDRIFGERPVAGRNGSEAAAARTEVIADVASWLFSVNGEDRGQVEITYVGQSEPRVMRRRDFLTPGLIDRAVQQAAARAAREDRAGTTRPGVSARHLIRAISDQVRAIVDRLDVRNAHHYVTIPDGLRPGAVRRIPASPILPAELERAG